MAHEVTMTNGTRPYHKLAPAPQRVADHATNEVARILRHNGYRTLSREAEDRIADSIAAAIITAARAGA